jgi:hypothetical protein
LSDSVYAVVDGLRELVSAHFFATGNELLGADHWYYNLSTSPVEAW